MFVALCCTLMIAACSASKKSSSLQAPSGSILWVLSENKLTRITTAGVVTGTLAVPNAASVATGLGSVWVATSDAKLLRINPQTLVVDQTIATGEKSTPFRSVAFGTDGTTYSCDPANGLYRIARGTTKTEFINLGPSVFGPPKNCQAIAVGSTVIWVVANNGPSTELDRLDARGQTPVRVLEAVHADRVAAVGDDVVTACGCEDEMLRIKPDGTETYIANGPVLDVAPVVDGEWFSEERGLVYINPARHFVGSAIELEGENRRVYLTDGDGSLYAVGTNLYRVDPITGETKMLLKGPDQGFDAIDIALSLGTT
jgi:hypothetical protein